MAYSLAELQATGRRRLRNACAEQTTESQCDLASSANRALFQHFPVNTITAGSVACPGQQIRL